MSELMEKKITSLNLGVEQVAELEQIAKAQDVSVSALVRHAVDRQLSEIDRVLGEQQDHVAELETRITQLKQNYVDRHSRLTPEDFEIVTRINPNRFLVEEKDGKMKILCKDCQDRDQGYWEVDTSGMIEGVRAVAEPNIFVSGAGGLGESSKRIRWNAVWQRTHRHARRRPDKDARDGLDPVSEDLKVEVIVKPEIREELTALFVRTWRQVQPLLRKIEEVRHRPVLTEG